MYDSEVNSDYDLLPCQACLSSNRKLTMVGDLVDVCRKICDNSPMLTAQTMVCWECMALLKKVRAFKKKVENAQKILDYCIDKHAPPQACLSNLTPTFTETTNFVPILVDDYEEHKFGDIKIELANAGEYVDLWKEKEEPSMFKIEDVRGQCDIVDEKPFLDLSSGSNDSPVKQEPRDTASPEDEHRRWQRAALHVLKRVCAHRYACHFLRPVSDELAPDYSKIVRRPTDLATIRRQVQEGSIRSTAELRRELLLMFSNALVYNGSQHVIYHMTQELRLEALRELKLLVAVQTQASERPARRRRLR